MFSQIKDNIKHLLESIAFTYKSYGIVYPIGQYFNPILRMLMPI